MTKLPRNSPSCVRVCIVLVRFFLVVLVRERGRVQRKPNLLLTLYFSVDPYMVGSGVKTGGNEELSCGQIPRRQRGRPAYTGPPAVDRNLRWASAVCPGVASCVYAIQRSLLSEVFKEDPRMERHPPTLRRSHQYRHCTHPAGRLTKNLLETTSPLCGLHVVYIFFCMWYFPDQFLYHLPFLKKKIG